MMKSGVFGRTRREGLTYNEELVRCDRPRGRRVATSALLHVKVLREAKVYVAGATVVSTEPLPRDTRETRGLT